MSRSPARLERTCSVPKETQARGRSSHQLRRARSCVRCPPPEHTNSSGRESVAPLGGAGWPMPAVLIRSEEHTSELQSLMRISYAVFCLKKTTNKKHHNTKEF